jgi:hypothetical protein
MDDGFTTMNRRMDELFRDLGAREEADKNQGREIGELRRRCDEIPKAITGAVAEGVAEHKAACAIGDITKTEVRLPERSRRHETYDTPERGTRRTSFLPGGGPFKIPRVVIWIGVIIGVAIAVGGWAMSMLLKVDLTDLESKASELTKPAAAAPADKAPSASQLSLPFPQSTAGRVQ